MPRGSRRRRLLVLDREAGSVRLASVRHDRMSWEFFGEEGAWTISMARWRW